MTSSVTAVSLTAALWRRVMMSSWVLGNCDGHFSLLSHIVQWTQSNPESTTKSSQMGFPEAKSKQAASESVWKSV